MKKNWRKVFGASYEIPKKEAITDWPLKVYKTVNKVEIANHVTDSGDKFPKDGDSAKKEIDAWKKENKQFDKNKKADEKDTSHGSPLMSDTKVEILKDNLGSYANLVGGTPEINWREVFADVNVVKQPDGTLKINVEENQIQPDLTQQQPAQQTPAEDTTKQASSNPVQTWEIKKKGNLSLIGKQCATHCGIAIIEDSEELVFHKEARNNHEWNEVINQGYWETKFDGYAK
jgi:hypothetical protein